MLPPKTDPKWLKLINSSEDLLFNSLPARMLMMRVKMIKRDGTPQKINECVEIAHEFFSVNEMALKEDVQLILRYFEDT